MTAALAEQGTYVLDDMRARWGWVNDCAIHEGHAYSVKAPGTSLFGVPAYAAYHWGGRWLGWELDREVALWLCRVTASILPWLVFLCFFYRFLGRHTSSPVARDGVFLSVSLGSCLYGYGILFLSHTLSAASAFGAFVLLFEARRGGRITRGRAFAAGLLTAGVTLLEYPGVIVSLALGLYALAVVRPLWRLLPFTLGGLVPTAAMMHFQWACFGSPFSPGHLYVENDQFREAHEEGFFGAVGIQWDAVYGLLVHPGAGLLPLTPILVFGVLGLGIVAIRRGLRLDGAITGLSVLATVVAIAAMNNWRGGWTVGPRYLAVVYPFLGWTALYALEPLARRVPRTTSAVVVGLTGVGLALSGVASAYYPHYPPEVDRPVTQVLQVLVAHDYAPFTLVNRLGVYGTLSMLPLGLLGALALVWAAFGARRASERWAGVVGGVVLAGLVSAPLLVDPRPDAPEVRAAVGLITRTWQPAGHDAAARLERSLRSDAQPEGYRRLAELYEAEGRDQEARAARLRATALERRADR
jgi:hypothetical protein